MSWIALGAAGIGAGGAIGAATLSKPGKTSSTQSVDYKQLPEYSESTAARGDWANTLKTWASQPGYGAIQPDWNSIWENARGKVNRYYNGGPEGPGLIAGVKSNLAARGMSENPASETQIANLGMQQGNQLQDIAVQQAQSQAALSEQGRQGWLSSIMQLAGLKPSFVSSGGVTSQTQMTDPWSSAAGTIGSLGVQAFGQNQQNQLLDKLLKSNQGSTSSDLQSMLQMFGLDDGIGTADTSSTAASYAY